jgi:4-amino-4-deoxy-L-arabinose transferase-like glycosyltransferase
MKKVWFKAKRYGWGWYPATWEGWMTILVWVVLFSASTIIFEMNVEKFLQWHLIFVFTITALLIYVSYKRGEKPGWRWGNKK